MFRASAVSHFLSAGLRADERVIVFATEAHEKAFQERLAMQGIDVAQARASGRLVCVDAREALSRFIVEGMPDPRRFEKEVTRLLDPRDTADKGRRIRVYGEMVDVLWRNGQEPAAIRLEELWNGISRRRTFTLLCGYSMSSFRNASNGARLLEVCGQHSHALPAQTHALLDEEIQKRREVEAALREAVRERQVAQEEARALNHVKDEFLATVSHELRTPLNAILGWAVMLRSHPDIDANKALEAIERNARAQEHIIEDVLDMSRIITGKLKIEPVSVDSAMVLREAVDVVMPTAAAKALTVTTRIEDDACAVHADADRLRQVFWNLLSNAVKFTPDGGRIDVTLSRMKGQVKLEVHDTGCGIRRDFLPLLFERFRQVDGSITRRERGLGLGLAIVRHLVELHGGSVAADSPGEGCGSTFTVRLPSASTRAQAPRATTARSPGISLATRARPPALEGVRVVVCDDDPDARELYMGVLSSEGASVHLAASAAEALDHVQAFHPDVLVSDIGLPTVDGYALIEMVRGLPEYDLSHTPAIAVTAFTRGEDARKAIAAGYQLHLGKPADPGELVALVANLSSR